MKIYCPECEYELLNAKKLEHIQPMQCPRCKIFLRFKSSLEHIVHTVMGVIILVITLRIFDVLNETLYKAFLLLGLLIGIVIFFSSKTIAVEDMKKL